MSEGNQINYKFNEDEILAELKEYIDKTYGQHYAKDKFGRPKTQTLEKIIQNGWGLPFCLGNVSKYADRGELKGEFRKDILKIIHYGILALHAYDLEHPKVTFTRNEQIVPFRGMMPPPNAILLTEKA